TNTFAAARISITAILNGSLSGMSALNRSMLVIRMAAYDIGAAVDAREIPSSNDQRQTPARVLPVLDYRTADSPGEPDRRLLGTGASIWAVVMLLGNIIALPAHDEYTHNLRRQDESAWSQNELQRRGCV